MRGQSSHSRALGAAFVGLAVWPEMHGYLDNPFAGIMIAHRANRRSIASVQSIAIVLFVATQARIVAAQD